MNILNSIALIFYYIILVDILNDRYQKKDILKRLYIRGLLFASVQIILMYFSGNNGSVAFLNYLYIFIFIHLIHKVNIKINILLTVIYLTINQMIMTSVVLVTYLFMQEFSIIIEIVVALIVSSITYIFYKTKIIDIFAVSYMLDMFYPILLIHILLDSTCIFLMYVQSSTYLYVVYLYIYFTLIIVYLFMLHSSSLKVKVSKYEYEKLIHEKEIKFLEDVISMNTIYQNDLHDMHSLLLKHQDICEDIKTYINQKEPLMRLITHDHDFNLVVNSLINIPSFRHIQIDALIIDKIRIDKLDLLIVLYELFNSINDQSIIHIISHNHLEISTDTTIDLQMNTINVINKYNGIIDQQDRLKIMLFY